MKLEIENEISKIKRIFPKSFVNNHDELILEPKNNIYFRLEDVESILDFKCKFIAWVSRPASKGTNKYWQLRIRDWFNMYLGTTFSQYEILEYIYTKLGNDIRRELCEKFVESDYDLEVIKKEV